MKIKDIISLLEADVLSGKDNIEVDVEYAFSSDLMSDVLAYVDKKTLLLTGLTNPQVIRTAEMIDMPAIIFVRNKRPSNDIIELAKQNNMVLLCTNLSMYNASGILYNNGLPGIIINV